MDEPVTLTWSSLSNIDYGLMILILGSGVISLCRGFVRELLSLITWLVAIWLALHFSGFFTTYLVPYVHSPSIRLLISILLVLVLTLLAGMLVSQACLYMVRFTGLSTLDRLVGFLFGTVRGAVIAVLLLVLATTVRWDQTPAWSSSVVIGQLQPAVTWAKQWLPDHLEAVARMVWPLYDDVPSSHTATKPKWVMHQPHEDDQASYN